MQKKQLNLAGDSCWAGLRGSRGRTASNSPDIFQASSEESIRYAEDSPALDCISAGGTPRAHFREGQKLGELP